MTAAAHIDFEGAAPDDLPQVGVHRWIQHPDNQCWVMGWRIGHDGPRHRWQPGDPDPVELLWHVYNGGRIVAHNAAFEFNYWNGFVQPRLCPSWPRLKLEQMDCTMARCLVLAIPGGLDLVSHVLNLRNKKDRDGASNMKQMAKPRSRKFDGAREIFTWWNDPVRMAKLLSYNDDDVLCESELDTVVPPLSDFERQVWLFDQEMNNRGFMLDVPLITRALAVRDHAMAELNGRMSVVTNGAVPKCTNAKALATWINGQGIECRSVGKGEHEELEIWGELLGAPQIAEALELRRLGGKSSTAKLEKMLECVCDDGAARGQCQYHGASTGRWAGRLIQPQNLHRVDEEVDAAAVARTIELLQLPISVPAAHDAIVQCAGEPMDMIAKSMRQMIIARPGMRFVGGDLSNIEGVCNAWLADETDKLNAYRAYQRGEGPDLYRVAYSRSFGGNPADVRGRRRQVGKVIELAYGYQGSVGAFIAMGRVYGVRPRDVVEVVRAAVDADEWHKVADLYKRTRPMHRFNLTEDEWTAIKITVIRFRLANAKLVQGWWDMQDAAISAVDAPGHIFDVFNGRVQYMSQGGFLWCHLCTGSVLAYCRPRLVEEDNSTITLADGSVHDVDEFLPEELNKLIAEPGVTYKRRIRKVVKYEGWSSETKQWHRYQSLYGGKQCQNNVERLARDALVHGLLKARATGRYHFVLTVHDEGLSEVYPGQGSAEELKHFMELPVPGLEGLPLQAKTWEDARYSK
jgi:DNA polymerase bacteriophage-type